MAILTTAVMNLIVILAIGIIVGLVFSRYGRSWLGRQASGATGMGDVTYALVGIAGSFIGFHIAVILGVLPTPLDAVSRCHCRRGDYHLAVAGTMSGPECGPVYSRARAHFAPTKQARHIAVRPHALMHIMDAGHIAGARRSQTSQVKLGVRRCAEPYVERSLSLHSSPPGYRLRRRLPTPGSSWHLCPAR